MDYTSDMNKDKKRWLFHGVEKNIQNTKQRKKNQWIVLMLLFLFEIKAIELIERGFMINVFSYGPKS